MTKKENVLYDEPFLINKKMWFNPLKTELV
jgi:hypothetical protein